MGKNKLKKFEEIKSFKHVIQVPFHEIKHDDHSLKGNWAKEHFNNDNPIILELGCGKGEYTVALANNNPDINYIGVDIKGARLWKGAKLVDQQNIQNAAFLRTRIELIEQFFEQNEVAEIWLTFPDPQMQKTRKRLTATNFMEKYRRFLNPEGIIHLKTDSKFQFEYTLAMAKKNDFEILHQTEDLYNEDFLDDVLQIKTYYEKQWLARGIPSRYLAFKINQNELIEPAIDIEKDEYRSFGRSARNLD